jgi:NAD(P)-dependent dehydrogenase (short-subunit alcohol dehydrogenase family)/acyl carrier protein
VLLDVVSEKTGYPAEMLGLDMALDADLGVDSIKRVEILSAMQERLPGAPPVRPEDLGSLRTLRHLAHHLAGTAAANGEPIPAGEPAPAPGRCEGHDPNAVAGLLVAVVSEKTGYPAEMLGLDMALDADLGVDSIKRVEILSALQERLPGAPPVRPEDLGSLRTLRHLAHHLARTAGSCDPAPALGGAPSPFERPEAPRDDKPPPSTGLERAILRVVPLNAAAPRRSVRPVPGSEVWVANDDTELAPALCRRLEALGFRPRQALCAGLPALGGAPHGLVLVAPRQGMTDDFLRDALRALRAAAPSLRAAGTQGAAVLATASRLDGAFGLAGLDPGREPTDGGLAGLAKTAAHEWPEVSCKALDLADDFAVPDDAAAAMVEEMFLAGPAEVGLSAAGRRAIERLVAPLPTGRRQAHLGPGDVVVMSGGARGITAEAAVALAAAFHPTLVLFGRNPEPGPEPDWLAALESEAGIKAELARRAGAAASPRQVGEQYRQLSAARQIRHTLWRVAAAGARVLYRQVDVCDPAAVSAVLDAVRRELGPVRGLIHGAGVLADARIEDKTDEQFARVYQTKVVGLRNLLAALEPDQLRALVLFSSSSGRFGRAGQADYAVANEILNKQARRLARRLAGCRVVALNWGPWDGGMVTPGLRKLFESEGVGLIGPAAGADFLVRELSSGHEAEVVVLAPGKTPESRPAVPAPVAAPLPPPLPLAFERTLERSGHPVLLSHQLDGRPVVPLALLLEWLAHAALHHNPGLLFHGCDGLRVLHGVVFDGSAAPAVRVGAAKAVRRDGLFVCPAEVRGRGADGREVVHVRADIVLAARLPATPAPDTEPALAPYPRAIPEVYRRLLFHGPMLHGIEAVEGCGPAGVAGLVRTAPPPAAWLADPLRQRWLADPLVLDTSFQLVVLWTREQRGAPSLPCHVRRYRQFRRAFPPGPLRVVARVTQAGNSSALADINYLDGEGQVVARLQGYECVIDPGLERAYGRSPADTQRPAPAPV